MAAKTLNIHPFGLTRDTTLVLVFQPPQSSDLFRYEFPVVWKAHTFVAEDPSPAAIRGESHLGFGYSKITEGDMVEVSSWTAAKPGGIAQGGSGPEVEYIGPTADGKAIEVAGKNTTETRADLTLGLVHTGENAQRFEAVYVWTGVGTGSAVTAHFAPIVAAYITKDYSEGQILRRKLLVDPIWEFNLKELPETTSWKLTEDKETGKYSIELADKE